MDRIPNTFYHTGTTRIVEPEPEFLAGAGAGENTPAPGPINLHFLQINFVQQVMTFIISLINIAIFTQIQRENRYGTLLKK